MPKITEHNLKWIVGLAKNPAYRRRIWE